MSLAKCRNGHGQTRLWTQGWEPHGRREHRKRAELGRARKESRGLVYIILCGTMILISIQKYVLSDASAFSQRQFSVEDHLFSSTLP